MDDNDEAPTAPLPTQVAGRYLLGEVLGRGGMAEVYRATDTKLDRSVAVKILRDGTDDDGDRARFMAEARTLPMLSHSGLVTVFDAGFGAAPGAVAGTTPGGPSREQPFLVMELVEGPTLAQVSAEGPVPLEQVGDLGVQLADALAYVHDRGVVHRDVKPGNVLVGRGRQVKLADFGIARLVEQATRHTRTSHTMGTAAYLAPEQVRGDEVGGPADVYALGLVLLEALTGRREFTGSTAETAVARLSRAPRIPRQLPEAWQQLLTAMTALDPTDRPGPATVAETLRGALGHLAPLPTVGSPDPATTPLLASDGSVEDADAGHPATRPLTTPVSSGPPPSSPPPSGPPPSGPPPSGPPRPTRSAPSPVDRLRALPASTRGVLLSLAALVVLLVALAVVSGNDAEPDLPARTPTELREPLAELHEAIHGEDG